MIEMLSDDALRRFWKPKPAETPEKPLGNGTADQNEEATSLLGIVAEEIQTRLQDLEAALPEIGRNLGEAAQYLEAHSERMQDRFRTIDDEIGKLADRLNAAGEASDSRLSELEEAMPNAAAIGEQLEQLGQAIRVAQGQIQWLAQQRATAETQMALQIRSTALDLAIKAVPGAGAETLLPVADALVDWLKAGQ